jgi:Nitrile hydratase, alpha chain
MDEHSKAIARVLSKAWVDPEFRKQLHADPKAVLRAHGLETGETVALHEDTEARSHFVIPLRPAHIKDEDLRKAEPHADLCCTACL